MRKLIVAGLVAAVGAAVVAVPASGAPFDHHFSVISKTVSGHRTGRHAFSFKDVTLNPQNRDDRWGTDPYGRDDRYGRDPYGDDNQEDGVYEDAPRQ